MRDSGRAGGGRSHAGPAARMGAAGGLPAAPRELTVTVDAAGAGERLDVFLARVLPAIAGEEAGVTRSQVQRMVREGAVTWATGEAWAGLTRSSERVRVGQLLRVRLPAPPLTRAFAEPIPLDVVYEDSHLIVVNKPRGMVVHPAAGHASGTLVNALLAHCPELAATDGDLLRPGIVHRLDRDTTGLIVAAKDGATRLALQGIIRRREFAKVYLALVQGVPGEPAGEIAGAIARNPHDRKRMTVVREGGREASTAWRILSSAHGYSLLEVHPHTGRTHQIRVHLASIGHPVAGDPVYGGVRRAAALAELGGQALHAWRLSFRHPRTGEQLSLVAPLPADLLTVLERLGIRAPAPS